MGMLCWASMTEQHAVVIYLKAITHPTLEIILTELPAYLERQMDKDSHIPLIKI